MPRLANQRCRKVHLMLGMITLGGLGGQMMLAGQPACQGSSAASGSLGVVDSW